MLPLARSAAGAHDGLWYRSLWEEERAIAGPDPYVWGFKKSRAEVDKMLDYTYRQGLVSRTISARGYVPSKYAGDVEPWNER